MSPFCSNHQLLPLPLIVEAPTITNDPPSPTDNPLTLSQLSLRKPDTDDLMLAQEDSPPHAAIERLALASEAAMDLDLPEAPPAQTLSPHAPSPMRISTKRPLSPQVDDQHGSASTHHDAPTNGDTRERKRGRLSREVPPAPPKASVPLRHGRQQASVEVGPSGGSGRGVRGRGSRGRAPRSAAGAQSSRAKGAKKPTGPGESSGGEVKAEDDHRRSATSNPASTLSHQPEGPASSTPAPACENDAEPRGLPIESPLTITKPVQQKTRPRGPKRVKSTEVGTVGPGATCVEEGPEESSMGKTVPDREQGQQTQPVSCF
jgi:hypothetical protein